MTANGGALAEGVEARPQRRDVEAHQTTAPSTPQWRWRIRSIAVRTPDAERGRHGGERAARSLATRRAARPPSGRAAARSRPGRARSPGDRDHGRRRRSPGSTVSANGADPVKMPDAQADAEDHQREPCTRRRAGPGRRSSGRRRAAAAMPERRSAHAVSATPPAPAGGEQPRGRQAGHRDLVALAPVDPRSPRARTRCGRAGCSRRRRGSRGRRRPRASHGSPSLMRSQVSWSPASLGRTKYRNAIAETTKRPNRISALARERHARHLLVGAVLARRPRRRPRRAPAIGSSRDGALGLSVMLRHVPAPRAAGPLGRRRASSGAGAAARARGRPRSARGRRAGRRRSARPGTRARSPSVQRVRPPDGAGDRADLGQEVGGHDGRGEVQRRHGGQRVPPQETVEGPQRLPRTRRRTRPSCGAPRGCSGPSPCGPWRAAYQGGAVGTAQYTTAPRSKTAYMHTAAGGKLLAVAQAARRRPRVGHDEPQPVRPHEHLVAATEAVRARQPLQPQRRAAARGRARGRCAPGSRCAPGARAPRGRRWASGRRRRRPTSAARRWRRRARGSGARPRRARTGRRRRSG